MNAAGLLKHFDHIAEAADAVARLRGLILDLAIRGKLVEQRPNEESAETLLQRFLNAKTERNRREKAKPKREHGSSQVASLEERLPNGWVRTTLADLVAVLNGRAYSKNELLEKGTPVLRVGNLFTSNHWYYSTLALEEDKYCDEGDLLFAWSASFGPFIWKGPKVIYHYHIWKLVPHCESSFDTRFMHSFLTQKTQEIKAAGHGVSMIHMTKEKMEKLVVALPPLAEQRRIVAKVDELMALCDQLQAAHTARESQRARLVAASLHRLTATEATPNQPAPPFTDAARFHLTHLPRLTTRPEHIQQLRQTILNLAVTGRLSQQGKETATTQKLGSVAKLQNGYAFKSEWFVPSGTRLVRNANVGLGSLHWGDAVYLSAERLLEFERFQLGEGDVVLSLDRPFIVTGTKVARVRSADLPCLLLQRVGRFVIEPSELSPDYLFLWVLSPQFSAQIDPGRSNGVPHVSSKEVEAASIHVPPLAEQHRIVAKVDELMQRCDALQAELVTGQTQRSRLLEAVLHEALRPA